MCQVTYTCVMSTGKAAPPPVVPLAAAVGRSFKDLRTAAGVTLNDVAKHARGIGLRWTASKVSDFEAGRSTPSFATVIAAAQALTMAAGRAVSVSDLLANAGPVAVTDSLELDGVSLAGALCGGDEARVQEQRAAAVQRTTDRLDDLQVAPVLPVNSGALMAESIKAALPVNSGALMAESIKETLAASIWSARVPAVILRSGLDEQRLAKRLDVSVSELATVSARLWGQSFSDERDLRAGEGANAQKRGQASRLLQQELRAELECN